MSFKNKIHMTIHVMFNLLLGGFLLFLENFFLFLVFSISNFFLFVFLKLSEKEDFQKNKSTLDEEGLVFKNEREFSLKKANNFLIKLIIFMICSYFLFSGLYSWDKFSYWRLARDFSLNKGGGILLSLSVWFIFSSIIIEAVNKNRKKVGRD